MLNFMYQLQMICFDYVTNMSCYTYPSSTQFIIILHDHENLDYQLKLNTKINDRIKL